MSPYCNSSVSSLFRVNARRGSPPIEDRWVGSLLDAQPAAGFRQAGNQLQNSARNESCRLRSPDFVRILPNVAALVGLKPTLFVPLQPLPLPAHQLGWFQTLNASARNCKSKRSVTLIFLNKPMFQFWN